MDILRDNAVVKSVRIDEQTVFTHQIMGENKVQSRFILPAPFEFLLGDYILLGVEKYYINTPPIIQKINNLTYQYDVTFEAEEYRLYNKILMDEGDSEFTYFGTPLEFLLLIVGNMNEIDTGWIAGHVDEMEPAFISFQEDSCRTALTKVCDTFELEFRAIQREIQLRRSIGNLSNITLEYGRNKGLKGFTRENIDEKSVVTRLYGFGGTRNLALDYRDGARKLQFDGRFLEANTDLYGVIEGVVNFPAIFPQRTAVVEASPTPNQVIDSTLDFNINDYLLEGLTAKIVFKTGDLAGVEFEISAYDNGAKLITFLDYNDDGFVLPSETRFPQVGDLYTLVDISMPPSYVTAAEEELEAATAERLENIKSPQVTYLLELDEKFISTYGMAPRIGDRINIKDVPMGIDSRIRVSEISYPLVRPSRITAVIADSVPYTASERLRKDIAKVQNQVITIDLSNIEQSREAVTLIRQLQNLIYDPDGYFDTDNIRPNSIETGMLSVGSKSSNFALNGVEIEANYQGNANALRVSGGQLVHFEIEIEGLGYIWEIDPVIYNALVSGNTYYLYARVSKTALSGTWLVSTTPKQAEEEAGFYHFWVGILYPVSSGQRFFQFTKGMTFIVGDQITTGTIKDLSGMNFFNLTEGTFKIGNSEQSLDWGVTSAGQLTINGVLVTKMAFAEDAEIINLIVKSLRTNLTGKRVEILESTNSLAFYNQDGDKVLEINDTLGTDLLGNQLAGMMVENPTNSRRSFVTATGIMSNASLMPFFSVASGIDTNASVVGILLSRNSDAAGISAGVVGIDASTTGNSQSFGGYFDTLKVGGLYLGARAVTANYTATRQDVFISCYNNTGITVTLPAAPKQGKQLLIRRNNNDTVTISAGSAIIIDDGSPVSSLNIPSRGDMAIMLWDGSYWTYNVMQ